jgi:tRNA1Val (adenine37-N6)-methyltransferase
LKNYLICKNERVDDLQVPLKNGKTLCIIQNPDYFCFGIDAVLIANFARVPKNALVADLGCGCGVIGLLIAAKTEAAHVTGLEIQSDIADMARRSVRLNGLDEKVAIENIDFNYYNKASAFDVVICNPPYKEIGGGLRNPNLHLAIARHEVCCTLCDVIKTSSRILKPGGKLNLIHRPERLADIICKMRENGIEPKRIRLVHPHYNKKPMSVLIEGAKGGRPKLLFEPPLYVYDNNNQYTDEIIRMYSS